MGDLFYFAQKGGRAAGIAKVDFVAEVAQPDVDVLAVRPSLGGTDQVLPGRSAEAVLQQD